MAMKHLFAALVLVASTAVFAGRPCEQEPLTPAKLERGLSLAQATAQALEAEHRTSGAEVVVLARAGQNLDKHGLRYSHLGFALRTAPGVWRVLHKLNECGSDRAALYRQGLGEFFLDDVCRYEAAWVVPSPPAGQRLAALLRDPQRSIALHHGPYNLVSYAWGTRYQQTNQWAIETLAAAMEPGIQDREAAQAWLKFKGYRPTTLVLGPLTRLGGRVGSANIAFDDHPSERRFADRIDTVTVDSMFEWLPRAGLSGPVVRLEPGAFTLRASESSPARR